MRSVSDERCRENQNTRFVLNSFVFENLAVYEIIWKNILEPDRPQMTIRRMRTACWIPKATNTPSEYVVLVDFPQEQ
jgi:hypothetical protein